MMRLLSAIIIILLFTCSSCQTRRTSEYFSDLESPHNLLGLKKTKYFYNGMGIYSLGIPNYQEYPLYGLNRCCFIKNGCIYMLTVDKNCYDFYKSHKVEVVGFPEIQKVDACNVFVYPFVDFNSKVGDTILTYDKDEMGTGHYVLLEEKKYSPLVLDTIYKFDRHLGNTEGKSITYYIAPQKGIVGMANCENGVAVDSIGFPFNREITRPISLDFLQADVFDYIGNITK